MMRYLAWIFHDCRGRRKESFQKHTLRARTPHVVPYSLFGFGASHELPGLVLLVGLGLTLTGCSSWRFGPYTAPRVAGRVVAADSGQPLAGVEVHRGARPRNNGLSVPKGGEMLVQKPGTRTDAAGRFTLPSERALTLFRPSGWSLVQLSFQRAGYENYQTNYSIPGAVTNTPEDQPLLETGDILLHRHRP